MTAFDELFLEFPQVETGDYVDKKSSRAILGRRSCHPQFIARSLLLWSRGIERGMRTCKEWLDEQSAFQV